MAAATYSDREGNIRQQGDGGLDDPSRQEPPAAQIKTISDKINALLPDDPKEAVTILALNYACVACCTGLDDESALDAVRIALKQMRDHRVGKYDH